ncbi:MAG TPA: hypothetical protein VK835_14065 [Bacteroidia bacterium]|nr:hypothetical protein [Bacteroidia bacterium]
MKIKFIIPVFALAVFSCKTEKANDTTGDKKAIARVFEKSLYADDIKEILPRNTSPKDSTIFVKGFIEQWITNELILHQAESNLPEDDKNIQKEIDEYRKNLLVYRYETELVHQKLDTAVNAQEIEAYYNGHTQNFMLKENIVKVCYVKINKKSPNADKVKKWYTSKEVKDQDNLKKYCIQYADNFFLDDNTWLLLDDVMKEIPLRDYNPELLLKTSRQIELGDSTFNYYLNIKDFKIKNNPSPLSFEKDNIRQIIINKRKLSLIEQMKQSIYSQAKENNNFEIYP